MASRHPAVQAAIGLRQALEGTAAALAEGRLDALLAGETALRDTATTVARTHTSHPRLSADESRQLRDELEAARLALASCRHLGGSLSAFVHISLGAQGRVAGYGPRSTSAALGGRDLNTRA